MRRKLESLVCFLLLFGILGVLVGLLKREVFPADPEETKKPSSDDVIDVPSGTYTLSGDWIIDENPEFPSGMERIDQNVFYEHKGVVFSNMSLFIGAGTSEYNGIGGRVLGDSTKDPGDTIYSQMYYHNAQVWSGSEDLRRISFGSEPQTVSAEFYIQFTKNATKATVQTGIEPDREYHKISGVWVLNSELDLPSYSIGWSERIEFTSAGVIWSGVSVSPQISSLSFDKSVGSQEVYLSGWTGGDYNVLDFGVDEIVVSNAFYRFLLANKVDGISVEGTWEFNQAYEVSQILSDFIDPVDGEIVKKSFEVEYVYDGRMHTSIIFVCDTVNPGMSDFYVHGTLEDGTEYTMMNPGNWLDPDTDMAEGKITFVEPQTVDPEFYNILTAIATPAA